jgi:hypothetical protein
MITLTALLIQRLSRPSLGDGELPLRPVQRRTLLMSLSVSLGDMLENLDINGLISHQSLSRRVLHVDITSDSAIIAVRRRNIAHVLIDTTDFKDHVPQHGT